MSNERSVINFTRGVPANESLPVTAMQSAVQAALDNHGQTMLQYGKAYGFVPLREWLAESNGLSVDQVLITNGSLQIVEFLSYHFIQPGDVIFTELPTYDRALTLLKRHNAKVVGIELEPDGPNIEALEQALAQHTPKFFYIIPDFQNPTGATCSLEKRQKIAALAEKHGFWILEDGPYRPLRFQGEEHPSFFDLAPERTLHMFAFTKLIGPGVRTGVLLGSAEVLAKVAKIAENTYICPALFGQGAVYEFCRTGELDKQIERIKTLYAPRLQACLDSIAEHLPDVEATRPEGGFFMSLTFPEGVTNAAVREAAKKYNLNLADGQAFFPNGGGERFLRLPYCALSPEEINDGVSRLAMAIRDVQAS
ncbi:PLP-dependent aminotransferase family protein [Anaerolineales bacterium HSG6]|nr:PLP-dependent aminotransferase family protein [Anaerolineales bacterium HSG6]MDM8530519.1 PLP-dependent aminotransferase family protein [Anaerolineales bacterium HSG25]